MSDPTIMWEAFIQNYLLCGGSVAKACARTMTAEGLPLTRSVFYAWKKKKEFRDKLKEAQASFLDDLRRVALSEATGSPKKYSVREDGTIDKIFERNRPVPVLLMFMMKALEPETYDDAYRLQLLRQEGSARLFDKYPLPEITFQSDALPDRIQKEQETAEPLPVEYTMPPIKNMRNDLKKYLDSEEQE